MIQSGGLSRAEAAKQRRELLAEIKREQRKADRAKLADIRATIASLVGRRKDARARAVEVCRAERVNVRERAKAARIEALALVRAAYAKEKADARAACAERKATITSSGKTDEQKERSKLAEERALQAEIRRIDARIAKKDRQRASAKEKRQESDDEVRRNLPAELLPLFEQVKRSIKATTRISRTEAFLHFAEEHPDQVVDAMQELGDRELARLQAEERRIYAELEREEKTMKKTAAKRRRGPVRASATSGAYKVAVWTGRKWEFADQSGSGVSSEDAKHIASVLQGTWGDVAIVVRADADLSDPQLKADLDSFLPTQPAAYVEVPF